MRLNPASVASLSQTLCSIVKLPSCLKRSLYLLTFSKRLSVSVPFNLSFTLA